MTARRADNRWKWISLVAGAFAILSSAMHVIGLPSCDGYITKAYAEDKLRGVDGRHKELKEMVYENARQINQNAKQIGVLNERTK